MNNKRILVVLMGVIFLFFSCAEEVFNPPIEEKVTYAIFDYFPLEIGDEWTWEVHSRDSIPEPYLDGDVCLGEPFTDVNGNGIYDAGIDGFISRCGEPINQDFNCNGGWDGPDRCLEVFVIAGKHYIDYNNNDEFDLPNGSWESGEPYLDLNDSNIRDYTKFFDLKMVANDIFYSHNDGTPYTALDDSVIVQGLISYQTNCRNGFSVDSLGLRWHSHFDFVDEFDLLSLVKPIKIAAESLQIGDSYTRIDTFYADTLVWTSTLMGVEDVAVPAGTFNDCLKFRFNASEWTHNMAKFNGTSYWWLAKDVGLVKIQGPEDDSWVLKEHDL